MNVDGLLAIIGKITVGKEMAEATLQAAREKIAEQEKRIKELEKRLQEQAIAPEPEAKPQDPLPPDAAKP